MKSTNQKRNLIGPRVMQERQKQGMTRKALLAELENHNIHMSPRTLSLLERQKRPAYDKEFYALAKVLNVSMNWLLGREN